MDALALVKPPICDKILQCGVCLSFGHVGLHISNLADGGEGGNRKCIGWSKNDKFNLWEMNNGANASSILPTSCLKNVISVAVYSVASWAISPSTVFTYMIVQKYILTKEILHTSAHIRFPETSSILDLNSMESGIIVSLISLIYVPTSSRLNCGSISSLRPRVQ